MNTQPEIYLPTNALKAALLSTGTANLRTNLSGVHVEVTNSQVYIVSTNRNQMFIYRDPTATSIGADGKAVYGKCAAAGLSVIIPADTIKAVLQAFGRCREFNLVFGRIGTTNAVSGEHLPAQAWELAGIPFRPVEGPYPLWRSVVPHEVNGELAQYNTDYLSAAKKQLNILADRKKSDEPLGLCVQHNGQAPGLARLGDKAVAVICPYRDCETGYPQWLHDACGHQPRTQAEIALQLKDKALTTFRAYEAAQAAADAYRG